MFNDLSWHDIEIKKEITGRPVLTLKDKKFISSDLSISHDGGYAIATVAFVLE